MFLALLSPRTPAQVTVVPVTVATEAAFEAALMAANARVFQTSATQPVVVEFANNLIGQTISLTRAMPVVVVDHFTMRVAGAGPTARVVVDAMNAPTAFRIASHHAAVHNVRFQNAGGPGSQLDVFTAFGTNDMLLANCDFDAAGGNALWLIGSSFTTVQDCNFRFSAAAIVATGGSTDLTVLRGAFTNNQQGVLLAVAARVTIRDCVFDANGIALAMQPVCADVTFGPGNVVRNTTGVLPSIVAAGAVRLIITGSQFLDNAHAAVQLRDLCAVVTMRDNVLLRNGIPAGVYQVLIDNCLDVQISGLQCANGGAGIFAAGTSQLGIVGSVTAPTTISGHGRDGISCTGCTDVVLDQITVSGNLQAVGGVQVALSGSTLVDVTGTNVDAALGPGRIGVRVDNCQSVRIGQGSSVLDNGAVGLFVSNSSDVVLGNWAAGAGSLAVRGPQPLQVQDSPRLQVIGTAVAPCTLLAGTVPSSLAIGVTRCNGGRIGPNVTIDGRQTAGTTFQIADSTGCSVTGVSIRGHTGFGLVAVGSPALLVRDCVVDGGTGAPAATGIGMLLNPGCHGGQLWGNLVQRQQGSGFAVVDSNDVLVGPGNRAIDNGGDGYLVTDNGPGPATRHATIQSAVAIGRGLAGQSGIRCVNMRMNLTNVTATRHGTGVLLQLGTQATLVNTISWGNNLDRNRDPASSGTWLQGMRGTTGGSSAPGAWSDLGMLVGVNPMFVSAVTNDVRLAAGSPAIDTGLHATPVGAGLPCADAASALRIRGAVIDRGAHEFVPPGGTGNSLDIAGSWLRAPSDSQLAFSVRATATQGGQIFLLVMTGSGTGPGVFGPGGTLLPIVVDAFTGLLLAAPALSIGTLDASGNGAVTLPIPAAVVPLLPELTFAAAITTVMAPTNPVVVRFLP